jgi:hypothetical protein
MLLSAQCALLVALFQGIHQQQGSTWMHNSLYSGMGMSQAMRIQRQSCKHIYLPGSVQ